MFVAFALVSASAPVKAQNIPEESNTPSGTLEDVQVRTRRDLINRFQSTGTRVNVTRQDIEAMGANTIGDILRQTPGLQVTTTANGGLEIRMRGMGPQDTRILVDGAPVSTNNRASQLPLDELPADLIERIEVVRAPTAEFQGAAGGTLNIVLRAAAAKRETYIWLTDQFVWGRNAGRFFVSQTGPLGAQPTGKDAEALANSSNWTYFVSLTGGHNQLGFNTDRATSTTDATGLKTSDLGYADALRIKSNSWTLIPRVSGRIGASDKLTLRGVFSGTEQTANVASIGQGFAGTGGTQAFSSNVSTPWLYERSFHQLGVDWGHSFKNAKWDTTVQFEKAVSDFRGDRTSLSNLAGVQRDQTSFYTENRRENAIYLNTKLTAAQGSSLWTFGAEHEKRNLEVAANTTFNQAVVTPPSTPPPAAGSSTNADVIADIRRSALWGQYEWPLESAKTTLTFGLRAQDTEINALSSGVQTHYQHLFWQPSINARTTLTESTQFRWNLARIVRNPRVWEINGVRQPNATVNTANSPDFQGNPALRPQTTLTMDVGVDHRLSIGGQAGLNLFVRNQSDVIGRSLTYSATTGWLEQPGNIGNAIVWGIESDVRTNLKWIGLPADWTLSANASLLQSRMKDGLADGQRIPGQARYLANLNIAKPLRTSGGWYGGASLALTGASDFNTSNLPNASTVGSEKAYGQLDLYVGSVFPALGFWRLNVFNVTDFRQDRSRTVVDNGIVYRDNFVRRLTPRWFLTFGTRF